MARKGAHKTVRLGQPDRSGPDPSRETLLDIASKRGLLNTNDRSEQSREDVLDPPIGRLGEAVMWSISLAMIHFTFDVLVHNQYAVEIKWPNIFKQSFQAFAGKDKI